MFFPIRYSLSIKAKKKAALWKRRPYIAFSRVLKSKLKIDR